MLEDWISFSGLLKFFYFLRIFIDRILYLIHIQPKINSLALSSKNLKMGDSCQSLIFLFRILVIFF